MQDNACAASSWLKTLLRFWGLRPAHAVPSSEPTAAIVSLSVLWLVVWAGIDWRERQPDPVLVIDGVPVLAWYALGVLALAALLRRGVAPRPSLSVLVVLALGIVPLPLVLMTELAGSMPWRGFACISLVMAVYVYGYLSRGLRAISGRSGALAAGRGIAFVAAFIVASSLANAIPDVWSPRQSDTDLADDQIAEREGALFDQADRIDQALNSVQRDAATHAQGFFLGFAGVGNQKEFAQEVGLAARVIGAHYQTAARQLSLINDERDLNRAPLASVSGLDYALQGLASRMQLDRDVLFLAISSHGSQDPAIAVSNSGFPLTELTPQELAESLRESGIQWRVILISACYAGGFIAPLRDARTLIITAAAADRTSFGCSSDSDLTYFGEAFYRDALPQATSLRDAFEKAKVAIAAREKSEGDQPSNPQAYFGAAIEEHLKALLRPDQGSLAGDVK